MLKLKKIYINLLMTFRKNKNYHQNMTAHQHMVVYLLFKPLIQRLTDVTYSGFRNRYIVDPFCSNTLIIYVLSFPNRLDLRICETKFTTHVRFLFLPFSISRITLNLLLTHKIILPFIRDKPFCHCSSLLQE